jgi:hypothetical protein
MSDFLIKVAEVIEEVANVVDVREAEKRAAQEDMLRELSVKFVETTGEELPGDVLEKLASDKNVLSTVQRMIEKAAGRVESLGHVSDEDDAAPSAPNKYAARDNAWSRFGNFINS